MLRKIDVLLLPVFCLGLFCCVEKTFAQNCGMDSCNFSQCGGFHQCGECLPCGETGCGGCSSGCEDGPDYTIIFSDGCQQTTLKYGGWVEAGVIANSHGATGIDANGPVHVNEHSRTDFNMNQFYLYMEKELDCKNRLDWGGRVDMIYGTSNAQSGADQSFDYGWLNNDDKYAGTMYQLYGQLGCGDLSVKYGKFITPIGWEGMASRGNFFYSHSLCYMLEPSTHVGAVADYALTDWLTLSGGWTAGHDAGFLNRYGDSAFLGGVTCQLTEKLSFYYNINVGKRYNGYYLGDNRFDDPDILHQKYSMQSYCFEWKPTSRFTYVFQYNVDNDADCFVAAPRTNYSAYGINNHFLYSLNDQWGIGLRTGWIRDNGGFEYFTPDVGDYYEVTLGVNWNPTKHWSFRPEIRYDTVQGAAKPFAHGTEKNQFSGGFGMLYIF